MRAIQVRELGGPDVLELCELEAPAASGGLVPVDVTAAGINYATPAARSAAARRPR